MGQIMYFHWHNLFELVHALLYAMYILNIFKWRYKINAYWVLNS